MDFWVMKLCKFKPIQIRSPFPSRNSSSSSFQAFSPETPSTFKEMVKTTVMNRDFKYLAQLFAVQNPPTLDNPFSFLSDKNQTQIVDEILQSFISLRHPRPHHAYNALLAQTCKPKSVELALSILQSMIRTDCKPVPQTHLSLSSAWCERRHRNTVREILSEMRELGYRPDRNTCNYLLRSLCTANEVAEARALLQGLRGAGCEPDSESYHLVIGAECRQQKTREAAALLGEMVVKDGLTPRQKTLTSVLGEMRTKGEGRAMAEMVGFLAREGCGVSFHNYEMVAETCLEGGEFVAAGKVVMEMAKKGLIPYIRVRQGVFEGLVGIGETNMAWAVRRQLVELGS